jgi:hypothetical protein
MNRYNRPNQALFDGNRGDIPALLEEIPQSGHTLWLLAAAADEEERFALLARVHAAGEQPYANMAHEILKREQFFANEIARVPSWQSFLQRNKTRLIRSIIALPFIILVVWIGSMFIFPPAAQPNTAPTPTGRAASQPTDAPTAIPTATVTALPMSQSSVANYMPVGSLRLLNIEYPTQHGVSVGSQSAQAPSGAAFVAIQYEFTCGTAQAFCDTPPQAQLALELSDASLGLIFSDGLTLQGSAPVRRIASGSSIDTWIVFAIPQNQSPRRLLIGLNTDADDEPDTIIALDLPR